MSFIARAAQHYLGTRGVYISALVGGITDVDAITLSVANMHRDGLASTVAARAVLIAAAVNTAAKIGIAAWIGGRRLAGRVLGALGVALAAGASLLLWS